MTYTPTFKRNNLVISLNLDEGSGSTAYDVSSNGTNGSITAGTYDKYVDGGYILDLDDTSSGRVEAAVTFPSASFSIEMYVTYTGTPDNFDGLASIDRTTAGGIALFTIEKYSSGNLAFQVSSSGTFYRAENGSVTSGDEMHIVAVFNLDTSDVILYRDGVSASTSFSGTRNVATGNLRIGCGTYNDAASGYSPAKIHYFNLFDVALSEDEALHLYREHNRK